jgi:hypothetical protein
LQLRNDAAAVVRLCNPIAARSIVALDVDTRTMVARP